MRKCRKEERKKGQQMIGILQIFENTGEVRFNLEVDSREMDDSIEYLSEREREGEVRMMRNIP